jgi:hypothetical protein
MHDLIQQILDAHGGMERWRRYTTVTANISTGGGLWALKGLKMPSRRRAYLRGPDGKPVHDLLLVAIDLDGFTFT